MSTAKRESESVQSSYEGAISVNNGIAFHGKTPPPDVEGRYQPIWVRRWRSGKIVWEGHPDGLRSLHRGYPSMALLPAKTLIVRKSEKNGNSPGK